MANNIEKQAKKVAKEILKMRIANEKEGLKIWDDFLLSLKAQKKQYPKKDKKQEEIKNNMENAIINDLRSEMHLPIKTGNKMLDAVNKSVAGSKKDQFIYAQGYALKELELYSPEEIIEKERDNLQAENNKRRKLTEEAKNKIKQIRCGDQGYSMFKEVCKVTYQDDKYNINNLASKDDTYAILKLLVRYNFERKCLEFIFTDGYCLPNIPGQYAANKKFKRGSWLLKAKIKVVDQETGKVIIDNQTSGEDKDYLLSQYKKNSDEISIGGKQQINCVKFLKYCSDKLESGEFGVKSFLSDCQDIGHVSRDFIIDMHIDWCRIPSRYDEIEEKTIDEYIFDKITDRGALEFYSTDINNFKVQVKVLTEPQYYTIERSPLVITGKNFIHK